MTATAHENSLLQSELTEARQEIASLKTVWNESRAALAKMKTLLLSKDEQWRARLAQAEEAGQDALEEQAKAHALVLDEARRANAGTAQEVGSHIATLARTKLDHAREIASWEARVARLEQEQLPELTAKLAAVEAELRQAHDRLESQSALHVQQLRDLQAEQVAREARFESELQAHHTSLSTFNHRATSLEENNEEYVSAIASLQRQLEAATLARDKLLAEERMRHARAELDAEAVANVRAQLEQAVKGNAAAAAAAKQRLEAAQQRAEELAAELAEARQREQTLQERVSALESAAASGSNDGTGDPSSTLLPVPASSPLHGLSVEASSALVQSLEERVRSMAESLLQRSSVAERLQAEKTALKLQLEHEQLRVQNLETQLRKARAMDGLGTSRSGGGGGDEDPDGADVESGASASVVPARGGRGGVRKGGSLLGSASYGSMGSHLTGLPPSHVVSQLVGFVDSAGLQVAILLRRHAGARVAFGVYVALVHLWAAFVFVHLMHEFGHESHEAPAAPGLPPGSGRL